jgi:signal transduction histidine kinase
VLASLYVPYAVPTFLIADVLAVSAFAHVLIGYNDVRRIRAEEVAAKTEKLAVLNRVLRHNLRTEAQAISGYAELLVDGASDERTRGHAETVRSHADRLGRLNTSVKHVFGALDAAGDDREAVDAALAVETAVATVAEKHPDAELTADVTAGLSVAAGEGLEPALVHLIENGVRHNDADTPRVHVDARTEGDEVTFAVADDGPGIPEMERSVVVDDDEITQLNHGQGLGLWVVKWTARAYGGAFDLDADDGGTTARLRLRRTA